MNTKKIGQIVYTKVDIPMNVFLINKFTNSTISMFIIKKHTDGYKYTHGIVDNDELLEYINNGFDIYLRESDQYKFNYWLTKIEQLVKDYIKYNNKK